MYLIHNGNRMVQVVWNVGNDSVLDENWYPESYTEILTMSERETIEEKVSCNTTKTKNRFHARTAGVLVGGFPCGQVTMLEEIYGAESLTQATGHVCQVLQDFPDINCLVYDDACHLKRFINKRLPDENVSILCLKCDRVHFKNHTDPW